MRVAGHPWAKMADGVDQTDRAGIDHVHIKGNRSAMAVGRENNTGEFEIQRRLVLPRLLLPLDEQYGIFGLDAFDFDRRYFEKAILRAGVLGALICLRL